jgi:hypothetical protein
LAARASQSIGGYRSLLGVSWRSVACSKRLACIAHKSLEICDRCRLWRRNSPATPETSFALRATACPRSGKGRAIASDGGIPLLFGEESLKTVYFDSFILICSRSETSATRLHSGLLLTSVHHPPCRSPASPTGCLGLTFSSKITQMAALNRSQSHGSGASKSL